jgi:hypothetical protein
VAIHELPLLSILPLLYDLTQQQLTIASSLAFTSLLRQITKSSRIGRVDEPISVKMSLDFSDRKALPAR